MFLAGGQKLENNRKAVGLDNNRAAVVWHARQDSNLQPSA